MKADIDILAAREARASHLQTLIKDTPLILIHANIPGNHKNTVYQRIIVNVFKHICETLFSTEGKRYDSLDGSYVTLSVKGDKKRIKNTMMFLEENHPLGRIVDLDVHDQYGQISRRTLQREGRKCFICSKDANVCRRENNHTQETLRSHIETTVHQFLRHALAKEAANALRREVFTYPCFGLVSHKNSGIHKDMNISHFLSAIAILKEAFDTYLGLGLHKDFSLDVLREQGKLYELTMLKSVGCNTHKGAHYIFGLILPLYIKTLIEGGDFDCFKATLSNQATVLEKQDFMAMKSVNTVGERAFKQQKIRGIRGEMSEGLPAIFRWYPKPQWRDHEKLIAIMSELDDTTLLKNNLETLADVKQCMKQLCNDNFKHLGDKEKCLNKKISPGGAADILSVVFFFERSDYLFSR